MKNSLERRLLTFSLLALILTVAVNTLFNVDTFRRSYRDGILQRAQTFAEALKVQIEAVINLGLPIDEISGISEICQETVARDPEISYCLVETSAGKPLYYNESGYPDVLSVEYIDNLSDNIAILQSPTQGKLYDYAVPILDYDDKIVGRVRIGFANAVLQQLVMDHLASTGLLLASASLVVFLVIVAFIRYDLVAPIQRLCAMAERLAAGKFDTRAPTLKTKELATLGATLSDMAQSLRERDAELSRNYEELEETNLELQKSYESLESISSELGRSREMYRSLLDDASDAILVCDEGDTIVIANKAAENFFGLAKARIEKSNYFSFLETINCRDIERQFEHHQTLVPGQSGETEIRFWRAMDNCNLVGQASASVIIGKDKRRLVQIIVRDITQEEEVRQNLERTASEMERLNQMKNSFMGLASHELKTPLTIIMGYVELLLSEREEPLDEDTVKLIRHIAKASDRLSEIVRDIVDVSMIDGRTVDLVSRYVDINVLVMRAANNVEQYINQREQVLSLNLAEDLPLIKCDFERIVQAIGNVLNNAIKFTPDKGRIIVETKLVLRPRVPEKFASVGADGLCTLSNEQIPYIEIAIYDSGIGIAEEEQEAIFEKFYEVGEVEEHSTGKVAFKSRGAGLGLSIVKGIIDLHGGAVWVESPGYDPDIMPGSTFYLLLPATGATV